MIKFIRKGGRIIPIKIKDVGIAVGASVATATAVVKARGFAMEKIRGKGKKGTGNAFATFALDGLLVGASLSLLSKKFKSVRNGINTITMAGKI